MFKGRVVAVIAFMLALSSCGGGSDGVEEACAAGAFAVTTTWTVVGGSYNPPPILDQTVQGRVGVALSAKPVHTGIPSSCVGKGTYTLGSDMFPLPSGLSLNATTGEMSGLPTAVGSTSGGGTDTGAVRLSFPGFSSIRVLARVDVKS